MENKEGINITLAAGGVSYAGSEEPASLIAMAIIVLALLVQDYLKARLAAKHATSSDSVS